MTQNPLSFSSSFCRVPIASHSPEAWEQRYQHCAVALDSLKTITPGKKIYYHWPDGKFYESNRGVGAFCERWMGNRLGSYVSSKEEGLYRWSWGLSVVDTIEAIRHVKKEMESVLAIAQRWVEEKSGSALDQKVLDKVNTISEKLTTTGRALQALKATYQKNADKQQGIEDVIGDFCLELFQQANQVVLAYTKSLEKVAETTYPCTLLSA